MKIEELIELLKQQNPNDRVMMSVGIDGEEHQFPVIDVQTSIRYTPTTLLISEE